MTISSTFAAFAADLTPRSIPGVERDRILRRIADVVGLVAGARDTPPGRAVRAAVADEPGETPLLFGSGRVSPGAAALVHGTLAHVDDFDDTFPDSVVHPSAVVVPAALASATPDTAGDDLLVAAAAGYEMLARLGTEVGRDLHARGFHATSVLGPLAAALVASRLRGAGQDATVSAIGLAASTSGGLLAFLADGTWSKRMHPGWAASAGLRATSLAMAGFTGPAAAVEGRHGMFPSFLERTPDASRVLDGLGERWAGGATVWKLLPCAHVLHPFVELVRHWRTQVQVDLDDIVEVRCHVAPWYVPIVCEPVHEKVAPAGEYQARASLPYVVALALAGIEVLPEAFGEPTLARADLRALAARVHHVADPGLDEGFGARLTVRTRDGAEVTVEPGDLPPGPDEDELLRRKFDRNLERVGGRPEVVWEAVQGLSDGVVGGVFEATAP